MTDFIRELKAIVFGEDGREVTSREVSYYDWEKYQSDSRQNGGLGLRVKDYHLEDPIITAHLVTVDSATDFRYMLEESGEFGVDVPGFGTAYFKDSYGGEGDGDQYWYVFRLVTHNGVFNADSHYPEEYVTRFFKVDGYYSSYGDGGCYDELYEVSPKQVMKTEWTQASEDVS